MRRVGTPPFVGRSRERAELVDRVDALSAGTGSITYVIGEAGIGKSALVDEVLAHAVATGVPTRIGRCVDEDGAPAFWPWPAILTSALAAPDADTLSPSLLDAADSTQRPAAARFAVVRRTADALARASVTRGCVIALDDLQWGDDGCLALVRHLTTRLPELRICVLATVRDPDGGRPMSDALAQLVADSGAHTLRLAPLPVDAVDAYVRSVGGDVDSAWPDELHRRSGGNAVVPARADPDVVRRRPAGRIAGRISATGRAASAGGAPGGRGQRQRATIARRRQRDRR